jgi:TrmH family RNA methyltransferase
VREAADAGAIVDLWITPEADARNPSIASTAATAGGRIHLASPEVLLAMSSAAQGLLAIVRWPLLGLGDLLRQAQTPALLAVFEEIRDPGNAGCVVRAADAAGAGGVVFTAASVDPRSTKAVRASAGSFFHLPVIRAGSTAEIVEALRCAGLRILAADAAGTVALTALREAPGTACAPTAWLFGNEARGLSSEARGAGDAIVRIPIYGSAESLNLAMAATLCLYETAVARAQHGRSQDVWDNGPR